MLDFCHVSEVLVLCFTYALLTSLCSFCTESRHVTKPFHPSHMHELLHNPFTAACFLLLVVLCFFVMLLVPSCLWCLLGTCPVEAPTWQREIEASKLLYITIHL
jgi:hypothetical protein